jgi:hypothetical protein
MYSVKQVKGACRDITNAFMEAKKKQRGLGSPVNDRFRPKSNLLKEKRVSGSNASTRDSKDNATTKK